MTIFSYELVFCIKSCSFKRKRKTFLARKLLTLRPPQTKNAILWINSGVSMSDIISKTKVKNVNIKNFSYWSVKSCCEEDSIKHKNIQIFIPYRHPYEKFRQKCMDVILWNQNGISESLVIYVCMILPEVITLLFWEFFQAVSTGKLLLITLYFHN